MKLILTSALCAVCLSAAAQKHSVFAVAAEKQGSFDYSSIQLINGENGKSIKQFFSKASAFEARTIGSGRSYNPTIAFRGVDSFMHPMGNVTGAVAFDAKNNRLFIAPIGLNQLRFLDLKSESALFTYIDDQPFGEIRNNAGAHITRMVIDKKGTGYALSNDGDHLIRFTTDKKITITDLGAVIDNPSDTLNGYHKNCSCMSYGGDMVADTKGDLYVITANNRVHKIEVATKLITYLGTIKGLPNGFTTNGAAVDEDGTIIVSSAVSSEVQKFPYYKFDIKSFEAFAMKGEFLNSSDLASNNFISVPETKPLINSSAQFVFTETLLDNPSVSVFPNPVRGAKIRIVLNDLRPDTYTAVLFDAHGRAVGQKQFNAVSKLQTEEMNTPSAQGQYYLQLTDRKGKAAYNGKLLLVAD